MMTNVLDMLENSTAKSPDKIFVKENSKALTYSQFSEKSKKIAVSLCRSVSVGEPVGVYMEKGIDALCTFFGAVYAGAFYSMLNTELPDARLKQIASVLCPKCIVTVKDLSDKAKELFPDTNICIIDELEKTDINNELLDDIRSRVIDTDILYINFTSGSTGVPKGIAVSHRSVIDFISCFTDIFDITEKDIIANQAPFDFDVSVKDIYSAINTGAQLVIVPRQLFSAPVKLIDYLCENNITTMIWAVSALCLISTFHGLDYKTPSSVNKILFSGEVMPLKHLNEWRKHIPDALYVNLYGPTEITCNCTYHILQKDKDYSEGIPIGKHFPNEDVFLLDDNNERITEKGKTGMIVVRGTALALGYYKLPEKNEECFVQNPLNKCYPELIYKTGDLGFFDENGDLRFCGRADFQVKHMGHRIELEEIERAMSAIDGVERCFCDFDEKKQKLKGYYVGSIEKSELHKIMRETMPVFMVPGLLRQVDEMILTKNGKIDRKKTAQLIGGQNGKKDT